MVRLDFFTAVSFGDQPKSSSESLLEMADSYFNIRGKKACVIQGHTKYGIQGVVLTKSSPDFLGTVLKVISYITLVLPIVTLILKTALRSTHAFHIIDMRQELESGIDLSEETIAKIGKLMPKIRTRTDDEEITWHNSSANNLVFSLLNIPGLIFKAPSPGRGVLQGNRNLAPQEISENRFGNMIKAWEVCSIYRLGLLIIPHAKKFHVDQMTFIAEERVTIDPNESSQESLYDLPGLNESVRQLATFIAKTGFSDVDRRNMLLVRRTEEICIALVDLEEMQSPEVGIFGVGGWLPRCGLIGCLSSEEHIDTAIVQAYAHGITSRDVQKIKEQRMKEILSDRQLREFYLKNGIVENPRKLIQVDDLDSLGLDLEEEGLINVRAMLRTGTDDDEVYGWETRSVNMRNVITDVIAAINQSINNNPENSSLKEQRSIVLDHNSNREKDSLLRAYATLGGSDEPEELNRKWLTRIINALVANGHLFKLNKIDPYGYLVQA